MAIRLIAIDLDGTLLTSDKRISQATAAALSDAIRIAGVRIVLASARPPRTTLPFHRQLELDTPIVCCNGALVQMPPTGQVLIHRPIPARLAIQAVQFVRGVYPEAIISAELIDRWCTTRFNEAYLDSSRTAARPDVIGAVETWLTGPVTKLLMIGKQDKLTEAGILLREKLSAELTIAQTEEHVLQVIHKLASKARCHHSCSFQDKGSFRLG